MWHCKRKTRNRRQMAPETTTKGDKNDRERSKQRQARCGLAAVYGPKRWQHVAPAAAAGDNTSERDVRHTREPRRCDSIISTATRPRTSSHCRVQPKWPVGYTHAAARAVSVTAVMAPCNRNTSHTASMPGGSSAIPSHSRIRSKGNRALSRGWERDFRGRGEDFA